MTYTYGSSSTSANYNRLVTTSYGSWAGPYYDADGNLGTCYAGQYAETYTDTYTYHPAGGVLSKTFTANRNPPWAPFATQRSNSVVASYTYDSSGRAATVAYPVSSPLNTAGIVYPLTFTYGYDGMGRAASLTDNMSTLWTWTGLDTNWVSGVTYDVAGRMTGMQRYISTTSWDCSFDDAANNSVTESMTYNANGQLKTRGFVSSQWNCGTYAHQDNGLQWVYSLTQNNGQITQAVDTMTGETINYTYDALKRLTQAAAAPISGSTPAAWTQNFGYDGFGNLTSKVVTGGSNTAPPIDPATNRISGISYDANGNALTAMGATLSYDEANRVYSAALGSGGTEYYGYGPDNKRIYRVTASGREYWTVYGAHGEKLGTFEWNNGVFYGAGSMQPVESCVWFGGRMIWDGWTPATAGGLGPTDGATYEDRVGTNRADGARFRPYGEEITSTQNEHVKFGTYSRDGGTGLDYAQQRYYASSYGRFNTVDPMAGSAAQKSPLSWNRYSYTMGDPVNFSDRHGTCTEVDGAAFDDQDMSLANHYGGTYLYLGACGLDVFANDLGQCWDASSCMAFANGTGEDSGGTSADSTSQPSPDCTTTILNAVNAQFGTSFDASNILPSTSFDPQSGGQVNLNLSITGALTPEQFNAIQPGRYAPPGLLGFLTGYGPSLHVVDAPSSLDPGVLPFSNSNIGSVYSDTFTVHIDSAWADNPIGLVFHFVIDVIGSSTRKPCP